MMTLEALLSIRAALHQYQASLDSQAEKFLRDLLFHKKYIPELFEGFIWTQCSEGCQGAGD